MSELKTEWWLCDMKLKANVKLISAKIHRILEGVSIGANTEEEAKEYFENLYGDKYNLISIKKENNNVKKQ